MAYELSDLDEVPVTFDYRKPDGSPGEIDLTDPPELVSSDETAATGTLAADAKTALIRSGDNLAADMMVTFTLKEVDVDLGSGFKPINIMFDMVIRSHTASEVSTVNVGFGTPTPKATAEPK